MKELVAIFRDPQRSDLVHAVQFSPTGRPLWPTDCMSVGTYATWLKYDQVAFAFTKGIAGVEGQSVELMDVCSFTLSEPWYRFWMPKRTFMVRLRKSGHLHGLLSELYKMAKEKVNEHPG